MDRKIIMNKNFKCKRRLVTILVLSIIVGNVLGVNALEGGEESNRAHINSVLRYEETDENYKLKEFYPNEEAQKQWEIGFQEFENQMKQRDLISISEAFDENDMVYVSTELSEEEENPIYLVSNENIPDGLKLYDGQGGEYYLWRYCKATITPQVELAEDDDLRQITSEDTDEKYFWVRTAAKVALEKNVIGDEKENWDDNSSDSSEANQNKEINDISDTADITNNQLKNEEDIETTNAFATSSSDRYTSLLDEYFDTENITVNGSPANLSNNVNASISAKGFTVFEPNSNGGIPTSQEISGLWSTRSSIRSRKKVPLRKSWVMIIGLESNRFQLRGSWDKTQAFVVLEDVGVAAGAVAESLHVPDHYNDSHWAGGWALDNIDDDIGEMGRGFTSGTFTTGNDEDIIINYDYYPGGKATLTATAYSLSKEVTFYPSSDSTYIRLEGRQYWRDAQSNWPRDAFSIINIKDQSAFGKSYTLTYNANKPDGVSSAVTVPERLEAYNGENFAQLGEPNPPTLTSDDMASIYKFKEWNTKADGTGTSYKKGAVVPAKGNVTLYARWELAKLELEYLFSSSNNTAWWRNYTKPFYTKPGTQSWDSGTRVVIQSPRTTANPYNRDKPFLISTNSYATPNDLSMYEFTGWSPTAGPDTGDQGAIDTPKYTAAAVAAGNALFDTNGDSGGIMENGKLYARYKEITFSLAYDANLPEGATKTGAVPVDGQRYQFAAKPVVMGNTQGLTATKGRTNYQLAGWSRTPMDPLESATGANIDYKLEDCASGNAVYGTKETEEIYHIRDIVSASTSKGGITSDGILYAVWVIGETNEFEVTYNANGGTVDGTGTKVVNVTAGEAYGTLPTPTRPGYSFVGWYEGLSGGVAVKSTDKPTKDTTLYARWKEVTYTITYNARGGKIDGEDSKTVNLPAGDAYGDTMPTPIRAGYTFLGWYSIGSGVHKVERTDVPDGPMVLYATWATQTYTLAYTTANWEEELLEITGGAVPVDNTKYHLGDQPVIQGDVGKLTAVWKRNLPGDATGSKYVLSGWSRSPELETSVDYPLSEIDKGTAKYHTSGKTGGITADGTLYARWELAYDLKYDANWPEGLLNEQKSGAVPTTQEYIRKRTSPKVAGNTGKLAVTDNSYVFLGWSRDKNATEPEYKEGADYNSTGDSGGIMKDETLYAVWGSKEITEFTLHYDANIPDGVSTIPTMPSDLRAVKDKEFDAVTEPVIKTITSDDAMIKYTFNGWNTEKNGSGTNYVLGNRIVATQNITLYAKWKSEPADVQVSFEEELIKIMNEPGKVNTKSLPKVKVNGIYATAQQMENMTYSFKKYVRTGNAGAYSYEWVDVVNDSDIAKLPIAVKKPEEDETNITASTKISESGIIQVTITFAGRESSVASCTIISPGDVNLDGRITNSDISLVKKYYAGVAEPNAYEYQKLMAIVRNDKVTGVEINARDIQILKDIFRS